MRYISIKKRQKRGLGAGVGLSTNLKGGGALATHYDTISKFLTLLFTAKPKGGEGAKCFSAYAIQMRA